MTSQTVTVTEGLADMEFAPKCEATLYHAYVPGQPVSSQCENEATQVMVFHTCKGCKIISDLECDDCVEKCKQSTCICGAEQYISSMPIRGGKK